ncbi:putative ester cyclase [Hasllibacter halocynthiae]|uniref:Putative ester cyclase n=1 Tax=Hasllibacter halocynthiae TaxID=595589 RepID=A0A2T0X6M2_9RHOB|nr:ester cyclase [Hasllibacter halocynthiae]PRY94602.1 putative ester cyclase [Hasllibacter halocynthiae]
MIPAGFQERFATPEDYVLGITREIWEERRVDTLRGLYADGLVVRSPASVVVGNGGIVAATLGTLAEFPDRELPGEDVIWMPWGKGFLSSHRLLCWATHSAPGAYGPPTGRRLRYRIIADCYCEGGAVRDEWLVRDQGAIVRQMGWEVPAWVRLQIAREGGPDRCVRPFAPARDVAGPYGGAGDGHEAGAALAEALRGATKDPATIREGWDRGAALHHPGHRDGHGWNDASAFWAGLASAVPSGRFEVHHAMGRDDPMMPPRAAVRWSLSGRHDGPGTFGAPSGAEIHVMGMTHAELGPRGIRREWTLFDETAVWRQIVLATG